ncbi:hypothetical protein M413DRAFT_448779 [Hebeloma cylindrosporum]|uniref:F-box domain-containing protein n=1 Tax=Hebeloma cylindrosporum TaxID=76867 RepID=A0A0C3BK09_HEBCY|nr:hypothetical protein M413DRAFT_448779 [Hebeloma cylindrosporum h7]
MGRTMQTARKSTGTASVMVADLDDDAHEHEDSEHFSDDDDSEDFSDEGSDYADSKKKGKPPPAKRAKKSSAAAAKQSSVKSSRKKRSLSLLPAMPLDVLFEVFSLLSPKDIINLSRTSRIFRDILMTRNATSVWKAARERLGAPECPSVMSEPQWAVLLFGNLCQCCGAKGIPKPEFALLRRVCISCKKENFLVEYRFKTRFPDVDPQVLELIPHTNVGAWSHGYARSSRFFWIPDIDAMLRKLAEYEHNLHLRRPGAKKALEDFKDQQIGIVNSIDESKRDREQWWEQFSEGRYNNKQAAIDQRFESIQSKFLELGYTASDVAYIRMKRECQQPALLTDRIWKRILPILEPTVLERKRERLERDLKNIKAGRRTIVHNLYQDYQKTLMPAEWKYLPRTLDICTLSPFAEVLDSAADVTVTPGDFEDAFEKLPEILADNSLARKAHARNLLQTPAAAILSGPTAPEPGEIIEGHLEASSTSSQADDGALDLATAVFTCRESPCASYGTPESCLFGWDDVAQHHCKSDLGSTTYYWNNVHFDFTYGPPDIAFSVLGSAIAAVVVRAVGLDESIATVAEVDAKAEDIRFGCSVCAPIKRDGASWTKAGYTWRRFVSHCTARKHSPDVLVILPPDVVAAVKTREMSNPNRSKDQWTCAHCTVHLGALKLREFVVKHVKTAHGIESPREPDDLFFFERIPPRLAFEAGYPVDPPGSSSWKTIRCLECAGGKPSERERLFDLDGVKNHIGAKHKIKDPVAGIHYR